MPATPEDVCVVGLDVGGTSTRAVVATREGTVARATGPGSNPVSLGYAVALATWEAVADEALDDYAARHGHRPRVEHCVVGGAGAGSYPAEEPAALERLRLVTGARRRPTLTSDVVVAFASVSDGADGLVVVAGTGAVAARVRDFRLSAFVDGNGWFVGDAGSGHWIGVEAVKAALATFQAGPRTALAAAVADAAGLALEWSALVQWVYGRPPRALAALAPVVRDAAAAGDAVATDILDRAAAALVASLARLDPTADDGAVVLAGTIARSEDLLHGRLARAITARWGLGVRAGGDGAMGAARIAWREVDAAG
ncbi:N-acetylglucosamine kinase [Georgenia faecalis]|uniref:N-acetylglucosamine kinase n=1 Tax=Georgenia faecalis TaxID=2483799 RepID=UPI000FD7FE56|nr:BadF/BadG/BcrA/BcrD ATPase family protein [Georgenia faecalis]